VLEQKDEVDIPATVITSKYPPRRT